MNSVADDSDDTARLLAAAHGRTVPTTATEMAGAVASMLRPASKAIFVHPYVAAERPRPRDTVSLDRAQDEPARAASTQANRPASSSQKAS